MENFHRNLCIILCISTLKKKISAPIHKSCSDYPQLTLCDAVEEGFLAIGIKLTSDAIYKVWKDRKLLENLTSRIYINISDDKSIEFGYTKPPAST